MENNQDRGDAEEIKGCGFLILCIAIAFVLCYSAVKYWSK